MIGRNVVVVLVAVSGAGAALSACSDEQVGHNASSTTMQGDNAMTAGSKSAQMVPSMSGMSAGSRSSAPMAGMPAMQPAMPASPPASQKPASPEPSMGTPSPGTACPTEFTTATKIVMDVSWPESLALVGGKGKVYVWTKSSFSGTGDKTMIESKPCGTTLPEMQTQAIAGGTKILPEIPDATWDAPGMPKIMGTAKQAGKTMTIEPGVALIGLKMNDPMGPWPEASAIMGLDHDGDGAVGITAVPRTSDGFQAPPTSIAQTVRTDKLYLAIRNTMTLSAQVEGCPSMYSGMANVTAFDNHVIGCHIQGGADCSATDGQFVDDNSPVYKVESATFTAKVVPSTATCADVRAALPATGM